MRRGAALLVLLAACSGPEPGAVTLGSLDRDAYVRDVQPILELHCATLDCHGTVGRPLRLYSETSLRAADALRGQPLSQGEIEANVGSIAALDPGVTAEQHMLVLKPLALSAGGVAHVAGPFFTSRGDPLYACTVGWLGGRSAADDVKAACAQAAALVRLPPP